MTMQNLPSFTRRSALKTFSSGFGYLAFSALAAEQSRASAGNVLSPKKPHFEGRAKRVIFLNMRGAPSHVDTFDYKPRLAKDDGKPGKYGGTRGAMLMKSPWEFRQHGKSGLWISDLFPHLAKQADELCLLRSMQTDQPNHPQAALQMHTGSFQFVRPSMGAWSLYGLGSENSNLPGFITLNPVSSAQNYGSSFLPAIYQGTKINSRSRRRGRGRSTGGGDDAVKIPNIKSPNLNNEQQKVYHELVQKLNKNKLSHDIHQPEVEGIIESFELGYRMQDELPKKMDLSGESAATLKLYGIGDGDTDAFGKQCLLARRFVEAGVRFVEITHGSGWDQHRNLKNDLQRNCGQIDQPIAGLLTDLKRRDMLKDTLVIWAGEFGRTPHGQGGDGRDHNNKGFTTWMAGGGVKGGFSYGATDEHGYEAVENKMHIHDWHATILHLLGLDHERLTYKYAGRDFRLTDVHGNVAKEILA